MNDEPTAPITAKDDVIIRRYSFADGSVRYKVSPQNPRMMPPEVAEMIGTGLGLALATVARYTEDRDGTKTLEQGTEYVSRAFNDFNEDGGLTIRLPKQP